MLARPARIIKIEEDGDLTTMTTTPQAQAAQFDTATIMGGIYGDGIIGLKGAFDRA